MIRRSLFGLAGVLMLWTLWSTAFAGDAPPAKEPTADPQRFANEIKAFEQWDRKNAWPVDGVLFTGSSSIRLWSTHESFPDLPVINRGFGGAIIPDVLHYFDSVVKPYAPRVLLLYCGDNDIAMGRSSKQVVADFSEFVNRVRKQFPRTHIIYLPIKPSIARWNQWPMMRDANMEIQKMAANQTLLSYVDTPSTVLGPDGTPRKELFEKDGLHLNDKGYEGWTRVVAPAIKAAMEATPPHAHDH